jgi:hypothetical protein
VGSALRTQETTFWRTTAEPPQSDSKGWLAGDQRFSEGVAERRDADLSTTQTLTTGFSKHQPLGQAQQNQDGEREAPHRRTAAPAVRVQRAGLGSLTHAPAKYR